MRRETIDAAAYDGLLLPGGHRARACANISKATFCKDIVAHFFEQAKPVAAIRHGVLLAARQFLPACCPGQRGVECDRGAGGIMIADERRNRQAIVTQFRDRHSRGDAAP